MKEPNPEKSCKSFAELISAYMDGQLTEAQTAAVEEHLKACPECARQLEQYRLINNLINTEKANCPVDLTATVMAGLEREQLLTGLDDLAKPPTSFRTWLLRTTAAAAMIGLIVYAGSLVVHFTGTSARSSADPRPSHNALARIDRDRAIEFSRRPNAARPALNQPRAMQVGEYSKSASQEMQPENTLAADFTTQPPAKRNVATTSQVAKPGVLLAKRASVTSSPASISVPGSPTSQKTQTGIATAQRPSSTKATATRPAESAVSPQRSFACDLSRQVPLTYTIGVPDLPSWMFIKEQVLDALNESRVPALTDGSEVRQTLDARTEFFYQARKGLDLVPGARRTEILSVVTPPKFAALHARLQQSGIENVAMHLHPELQRLLANNLPSPALAGLVRQTQQNLVQYFGHEPYSNYGVTIVNTAYSPLPPKRPLATQTAPASQPVQVPLLPVLIDVEVDPRLTTAPSPTTRTTQPTTRP